MKSEYGELVKRFEKNDGCVKEKGIIRNACPLKEE